MSRFSIIWPAALLSMACSGRVEDRNPVLADSDSSAAPPSPIPSVASGDAGSGEVDVEAGHSPSAPAGDSASDGAYAAAVDSSTVIGVDAALQPLDAAASDSVSGDGTAAAVDSSPAVLMDAAIQRLDAAACGLSSAVAARWIAFDSDRAAYNRDIYLVRADGSQVVRVTSDPTTEKTPAFSNSGAALAFASDRSGSMQIYTMNLATHAVQQLTSLPAGADEPSWSMDDSRIVFHSGASVYIMDSDGTNAQIVGTGLDDFNAYKYPAMTPDGAHVVFDRNNEIDALNIDGTGFRYVVSNTTTTIETPSVSPDGINVAFATVVSSLVEQIAVGPFAGTTEAFTAQTVTPVASGSARRPAWGPENVIAFEHGAPGGGWQISTASIALSTGPGSTPCDVVGPPGDSRNPSWAPAGFQPQ